MGKVKIISDSTCDLSMQLCKQYDIDIIPMYVILGERDYLDGVELEPKDLFQYCDQHKTTPKTAAPSLDMIYEMFSKHIQAGYDVVYIGISGMLSATIQNASLAAKEFPEGAVYVVDSKNLSTGVGLLVLRAAQMAQQGKPAHQIAQAIEETTGLVRASFIIDTMTYLYRGGRCTAVQAVGASILQLKPEIIVEDGKMHPGERYRGNIIRSAKKYAKQTLKDIERINPERVFITYSLSDIQQDLLETVDRVVRDARYFKEICHTQAGCVISSHCGPSTIGVLYILKSDKE